MKKILFISCLIIACNASSDIKEGRWTGYLTPMNHPDMNNPINYDVAYLEGRLTIEIIGPDETVTLTQNPHIERDTLFFSFNEPEEQMLLNCALAKNNGNEFSGNCTDSTGKWAVFSMMPPD